MTSVSSGRRRGLNASTAIKSPVIAASTGNLTLSAAQTVDGIALVATNRVLCKNQTDASENGIYAVNSSTWVREPDWDGIGDVVEGTMIPVSRGTTNALTWWLVTNTGTITIGTTGTNTDVTFAQGLTDVAISATSTVTDESTDTTCFPVFMTAATGNNALKSGTNLTFNSNTGEFGATIVASTGKSTATTFEPTGDTSAGDNSALGYTVAEGAIVTGQGLTSDVTIKNDADAEVMSVPTGTTTAKFATGISVGAATPGTGGVAFPATAVAVTDANTLDDYEEGEFVPTLTLNGSGTVTMATNTTLSYTKIGRVVHINGVLGISGVSSPVGDLVLGNLPFTSRNATQAAGRTFCNVAFSNLSGALVNQAVLSITESGTTGSIKETDGAADTTLGPQCQAGTSIGFNFFYEAA